MSNLKRGQVTVFIVIGLLILGTFLVLWSVKRSELKQEFIDSSEVPAAFKPVQRFVTLEISKGLLEAVKNAGQHGGYVNPYRLPQPAVLDVPTESMLLKPFIISNRVIPYWYYMSSPNMCNDQCTFKTLMPPLNAVTRNSSDYSVEAQIDRYLQQKLISLDFSSFKYQGIDVKKTGLVEVETRILDGKVTAEVNFPLELKKEEHTVKVQYFESSVDADFKRAFELASRISLREKEDHFLEDHVINLISVYSDVASERLPPIGRRTTHGDSPVYWNLEQVNEKLALEVLSKISLLTIENTDTYNPSNLISGAVVNIGENIYDDISVRFLYPNNAPAFLEINDLPFGFVGPNTQTRSLLNMFMISSHDYNFAYDISFPVLVTLRVPYGIEDEPLTFQFALEGNIRNNKPAATADTGLRFQSTMLCNEEQRLSGVTNVRVAESSGAPIANADVYYSCADDKCYVGKTGNDGLLQEKLPLCIGGTLEAIKPTYLTQPISFNTTLDQEGAARLVLDPTRKYTLDLKKLEFSKDGTWPHTKVAFRTLDINPEVKLLESDEQAIISFKRTDGRFQTVAHLQGASAEVLLAPGKYEVSIRVIKEGELTIPEKTCGMGMLFGCAPMNETSMSPVLIGGAEMKAGTAFDFDGTGNFITLYAVTFDLFGVPESERTAEDLAVLGKLNDYSAYLMKFKPEIS